nr:DUF6880 family protein [uncultured Acidocella sp.]
MGHQVWLCNGAEGAGLSGAATLGLERAGELDGDLYEGLTPASGALAGKHKLAAVLVLRAMIDFALTHNRFSR